MVVLIVDDEAHIRDSLCKYLALEGIDAQGAATAEAAAEMLAKERFDAAVVDLKLPGMSGQDLLSWMRDTELAVPTIMISAHGQIPDAVDALKTGAKDYLVKPFDPADLVLKIRTVVDDGALEDQSALNADSIPVPMGNLIGDTPLMRQLSLRIEKLAAAAVTILITGESGTGKEAVALEIHRRGDRRDEPFTPVNIGGIHEGLMESELFGHEKGAFTGAAARRIGLFELAGQGTLFLDEIGEMPLSLQVKLLRVLQERKIRRLGGTGDIPINARIISATNRDLEQYIREGRFREDLYYRLNVFRIQLPPLRERRDDIPLLAEHLLQKLCSRMGTRVYTLSPEALEKLMAYPFPGNVRELENILERALIYGEGSRISARDIELPQSASALDAAQVPHQPGDLGFRGEDQSLEAVERKAIRESLARNRNNHTKTAEELGISRKTLLNKIRVYNL